VKPQQPIKPHHIKFATGCGEPEVTWLGAGWYGVDACGRKFKCANIEPEQIHIHCDEIREDEES